MITHVIKIAIIISGNLKFSVFLLIIKIKITNKGPKDEVKSFRCLKIMTFIKFIDPPLNKFCKLS